MERYNSYKDSGVKWLGEIPNHWRLVKSKYLWKESFATSENGNEELLSVSQYDGITPAKGDPRSESLKGYKIVSENDLVINIMLAWMGGLGVSDYNGIVSPAYCIYKLNDDSNPKFLHYLYKTPLYLAEFARHSTGVIPSRWRMYTDDFGQVLSLIPPREEQDAIVSYLDERTAKIDAAIAQQQKMIDLLNERKQIIINSAVTKGLAPNAKMKDSGVDWIGKVPEHWEIIPLKRISTSTKVLVDPQSYKGKMLYEYSMPSFDNMKAPELVSGVSLESSKIALSGPTLLVNKLNVHKKRIWYVESPYENSVASTEFIPFKLHDSNPHYLEYYLLSDQVTDYLKNNTFGATNSQRRVAPEIVCSLLMTIPPVQEQQRIVDYLDRLTDSIAVLLEVYNKNISLLQERKQIIINEVVTGKLKVV